MGIKDIRPWDADLDKIRLEDAKEKSHSKDSHISRRIPGRPKVSYPENTQAFKSSASAMAPGSINETNQDVYREGDFNSPHYTGILNVNVDNLNMALRMCNIEIHPSILKRVIDVFDVLEAKGYNTSIRDIELLKSKWSVQGSQELIANEQKK